MPKNPETYMLVGTALRTLASDPDNATIWSCIRGTARSLGYTYFTAGDARRIAAGSRSAMYSTDLSDETLTAMESENLLENHPIVQRSLETTEAFTLSSLEKANGQGGERWVEALHEIARNGDGIVVPVYDGQELAAIFVYGGENIQDTTLAKATLQVLSHAAYAARTTLEKRGAQTTDYSLTSREVQCLRAVAQGMLDPDIGKMLAISARTVRFHVDNAKHKLGVDTRLQAITKALREKLFEI